MGVLSILCGLIAILFVPETLDMDVPDTPEEARKNTRYEAPSFVVGHADFNA